MSLVNLLEFNGASVVAEAIDNNRGIAIAKMMWGFLVHMKKGNEAAGVRVAVSPSVLSDWAENESGWNTPTEIGMLPDLFVTQCYVLGETDFKSDVEVEAKVRRLVVDWESKDANTWKLWSYLLNFSYQGINRTLDRLGNRWDHVWHEHEHYQDGKEYVEKGLESGVFNKLENGAVLTDLLAYNIPDTILLKGDGTSLYITQDIALTALKKKAYSADKLIWVIGPEQSLAMKQMFAVCEQLGIGALSDFTHVPYGYVGLKSEDGSFKKMSSRAGTVVLIDDVIDAVKARITDRIRKEGDKEATAEKLALAAVKFGILKSNRNQTITFDIEQATETKGDSGVYIVYAYVRALSILQKGRVAGAEIAPMSTDTGGDLAMHLAYFPEAVRNAVDEMSVHLVAQYALHLCQKFNAWYAQSIILDGGVEQGHKLSIVKAYSEVMNSSLRLLGIVPVQEI
jgi:arginyl-tRNA synthetase